MKSSAPAKTILFGEHAVVYGEPAIAIPLPNIRTYAEIHPTGESFRIKSENTGVNNTYDELDPASGIKKLLDLLRDEFSLFSLPSVTLQISSDIPIASGLGSGAALSVAIIRGFAQYFHKNLNNERINEIAYENIIINLSEETKSKTFFNLIDKDKNLKKHLIDITEKEYICNIKN